MSNPIDQTKLNKLAEVAVKVGLRLEPGQDLIMTSTLEAAPLARMIAEHAYKAGAGLVTTLYSDPEATLLRYKHGADAGFDKAADWLFEGMGAAFDQGAARLAIAADNPMLLANEDADKVGRANKAMSKAGTPVRKRITEFLVNWNIVAYPGADWAKLVFPDDSEDVAVGKLADAIFAASRVDLDDPIGAWEDHNAKLATKSKWLNDHDFSALKYTGPGTDLTIGLADGHEWMGGSAKAKNGITCNPNIPTEEVFTTPHAHKVDGVVRSTKPLSYAGSLIDNIAVKFEKGKIVQVSASAGEDVWVKVLDTDEGARRIGEVALVPHSSPISQSGILFFNTLFDENAACHIAQGQCYTKCFKDTEMSGDQVAAAGGNSSAIHIDWMIGSDQIDIDGIKKNGDAVPVFRKGEWA